MKIIKADNLEAITSECSECHRPNFFLLEIGERPDYDSNTAFLCFDCLNKALNVAKRQIPKDKRRLGVIKD